MPKAVRLSLKQVFTASRLKDVFKNQVWDALRDQECNDLLSYYDYRRNLSGRADQLAATIYQGNYRPKASLQIAISKSDLLARIMHIPHPDDALVLQVISEALLPIINKRAPSRNAYFARSHQEHTGLHTQSQFAIYPWFKLWPRYQQNILKFAKTKKYLVITDVQNFFDSVSFLHARRRLQTVAPNSLQLVDLMLLLFENFIRREMYAPILLQGIPTIDVDAPRLVGHTLLFGVDRYLQRNTGSCFARWMDDINFGVNSIREARERIRDIDQILRTLGLRLSGSKTKILSFSSAEEYLQAAENQALNVFNTKLLNKAIKPSIGLTSKLIRAMLRFHEFNRVGYWDKVMRRFYKILARQNSALVKRSRPLNRLLLGIEKISRRDFTEITTSEYRLAVIDFWRTRRITNARLTYYLRLLDEVRHYDDAVTFGLLSLLSELKASKSHSKQIIDYLLKGAKKESAPGMFFGASWFLAINGSQRDIVEFVNQTRVSWEANYFFARQAIALWSLLPIGNPSAKLIRDSFIRTHDPSIRSAVEFIEELRVVRRPDESLRNTLPWNKSMKHLDIRRAILSSNVMRSSNLEPSFRIENEKRVAELTIGDQRLREIALGAVAT